MLTWNNVAEPANTTYREKFREKAAGFAIMEKRRNMHWKQVIPTAVKCMRKENEQIDTFKSF